MKLLHRLGSASLWLIASLALEHVLAHLRMVLGLAGALLPRFDFFLIKDAGLLLSALLRRNRIHIAHGLLHLKSELDIHVDCLVHRSLLAANLQVLGLQSFHFLRGTSYKLQVLIVL